MDWKQILSKVSTKGDLATVLLAGTAGFVGDVALSLAGVISPGTCAVLAASAALGAKNGVQAGLDGRRARRTAIASREEQLRKTHIAIETLYEAGLNGEALRLRKEVDLFMKGLSDETELASVTKRCLDEYRIRNI
jgi:hypothetical protein